MGFEDPVCQYWVLEIDTMSNPSNIWQVGNPDKTVFTGALFGSNAIVTDSLDPYPTNDTSSFTIVHPIGNGFYNSDRVSIQAEYQVNSDSLTDFGLIEFSPDNGLSWIDLLNDTVYDDWYSWGDRPVLTGNSNGWQVFTVDIGLLGEVIQFEPEDTVLYRFSFISDSVQTGLDGLVYDQFYFDDWAMGINEKSIDNIDSKVYPNPTNGSFTIEFDNQHHSIFELVLTDGLGRQVYTENTNRNSLNLLSDRLESGFYFYRLTDTQLKRQARGKFVVEKE